MNAEESKVVGELEERIRSKAKEGLKGATSPQQVMTLDYQMGHSKEIALSVFGLYGIEGARVAYQGLGN